MKRWWLILALLLSLGANLGILATLALGGRQRDEPAGRPLAAADELGPPLARLADRLDLEGAAREEFVRIHQRFFAVTREQRRRAVELRRRIVRELVSPSPDPDELQDLVRQAAAASAEMEKALVETTLRSRRLLPPGRERVYLRLLTTRLARVGMPEPGRPPRRATDGGEAPRRPAGP